jgi:hypothetical protein
MFDILFYCFGSWLTKHGLFHAKLTQIFTYNYGYNLLVLFWKYSTIDVKIPQNACLNFSFYGGMFVEFRPFTGRGLIIYVICIARSAARLCREHYKCLRKTLYHLPMFEMRPSRTAVRKLQNILNKVSYKTQRLFLFVKSRKLHAMFYIYTKTVTLTSHLNWSCFE